MKSKSKKGLYKQIALALSLCALIVWGVLGTGASLAWFSDTSTELNNIFHVAEFDLLVSHRLTDGSWEEVDSQTKIFEENALYEPGYVQIVYLKVDNNGDVPFEFYTAVNVNGFVEAINVIGDSFKLQNYLKFGITISDSEADMKNSLPNREKAVEVANLPLHNYSTDTAELAPGETKYIAIVVRMPKDVGNIANYRGDTVPSVDLGITVKADQIKK